MDNQPLETQFDSQLDSPPSSRSGYSRLTRALLGAAFLLLMLGLANVIYGTGKIRESSNSLSRAKRELSRPNSSTFPLVDSTLSADQETMRIRHLQSSVDYYTLVRSGGKLFMLTGVLALLTAIFVSRRTPAREFGGTGSDRSA